MRKTEWTTHCFGRLLIDLPPGAEASQTYSILGDKLEKLPVGERDTTVAQRQHELEEAKHDSGTSLLVSRNNLDKGSVALLSWVFPESQDFLWQDLYLTPGGKYFYRTSGDVSPEKRDSALAFAAGLASAITPREGTSVPSGSGYCIDDAFIAGNKLRSESFSIEVKLPNYPDVILELFASTQAEPDKSLLERAGGFLRTEVLGPIAGMKTLRKGERDVGPIQAEELLFRATEGERTYYIFKWEAPGKGDSISEPNISVSLGVLDDSDPDDVDAPKKAPSLTSDEEAMQLWDAIIDSVRLRPGAV